MSTWASQFLDLVQSCPTAESRHLDYLRFARLGGASTAQEVLHALGGMHWRDLEAVQRRSGKPLLDVGASYSTLAIEGAIRPDPISIVPLDPCRRAGDFERGDSYVSTIIAQTLPLAPLYTGTPPLEMTRFIDGQFDTYNLKDAGYHLGLARFLETAEFSRRVQEAAQELDRAYLHQDVASLNYPDRHFSACLAHRSVPLHTSSSEHFFAALENILRMTDSYAVFSPFYRGRKIDSGPLQCEQNFRSDPKLQGRVKEIAAKMGFDIFCRRGMYIGVRSERLDYRLCMRGLESTQYEYERDGRDSLVVVFRRKEEEINPFAEMRLPRLFAIKAGDLTKASSF